MNSQIWDEVTTPRKAPPPKKKAPAPVQEAAAPVVNHTEPEADQFNPLPPPDDAITPAGFSTSQMLIIGGLAALVFFSE